MAQQINLEIVIDGSLKVSPFSFVSVHQQINGHHYFEVHLNHDVESGNDAVHLTKFQKYLGKKIAITFGADLYDITKNHKDIIFMGIITDIAMSSSPNDPGNIIIKGYSPTILLESNENCSVFLEKNLKQIVTKISEKVPSNLLSMNISPKNNNSTINYCVQYNESNFDFLKRLAADFGEWLMYDGDELFFGKPSTLPNIQLSFPEDISDLNLKVKLSPVNFTKNSYSLKKTDDKYLSNSSSVNVSGLGIFGDNAFKQSKSVFSIDSNSPTHRNISDKSDLDSYVKNRQSSEAASLAVLQANCDNPGVHVGTIVDVKKNGTSVGKFLVISVAHSSDGLGNYSNVFEAIPAEVDYLPSPVFKRPYVEPQIGKIIDNKDPKGLGKVKVQLTWQKDEDKSSLPWIPVMTPSAGGKNKNRGFHFTPEIDDYVLVGFTENDPSKPFVMGSITTEENRDSKPDEKNFEKIIRTRSGNTIYFRDKEQDNEQEVRIETDKMNYMSILVNSDKGTIEINSTKVINIIAKDDVNITSEKTVHVKSKDITIEAQNDIVMKAQGKIAMQANKDITAAANGKVDIKATQDFKAAGMNAEISGQIGAKVKGSATAELSSGAQTTVKGAMVMIN